MFRWDRTYIDMGTLVDWPHIGVFAEIACRDSHVVAIESVDLLGKEHDTARSIRNFFRSKWNQSQGFEDLVFRQWWRIANLSAGIENPRLFEGNVKFLREEGVKIPRSMKKGKVCRDDLIALNISFPSGYQRYEGRFVFGDSPEGYSVGNYKDPKMLRKGESMIGSISRSEPAATRENREEIVLEDDEESREIRDILRAKKVLVTGLYRAKWFILEYGHERLPKILTGRQRRIDQLDRAET